MVSNDELYVNSVVAKAVNQAAKQVGKTQRGYLPEDDLRQSAWLWVFDHGKKVSGWLEADESKSSRNAAGLLSSSLRVHLHSIVQKERIEADGTLPQDYYNYSRAVVEALLPDVFDEDAGSTSASPAPKGTYVRHSKQPSEGNEYQAMLADVRAGFASLQQADKRLLWDRFAAGGNEVSLMATTMDVPERTVRYRVSRAVNRIIRHLGGEQPRRMRPPRTNAAAVVEVRQLDEGK